MSVLYILFYSYILPFALFRSCLRFSFSHFSFYLCGFLLYILFEHCWREPENLIANDCFTVIVVHVIYNLKLVLRESQ